MGKLYVAILLVIFGGIVLHAPLTVWLSSIWPQHDLLIKSWKEILLGIALILAVIILTVRKKWSILFDKLFYLIGGFAILCLLLIVVFGGTPEAIVAGLLIDLRYLLYFTLVFVALRLYPQMYRPFMYVLLAGAFVVIGFAVLQITILPDDILKYLGYSRDTISPFLTVDNNPNYVRINSTLRGPNPLGAYAIIVLAALTAFWLSSAKYRSKKVLWVSIALGIGSFMALWSSYSRSAAIGAVLAIAIIIFAFYGWKLGKKVWISMAIVALVLGGGLFVFRETQFVSQVILHEDPHEEGAVNSNDGHADSLIEGTQRMLKQPLGAGVGSTGSASLLGDSPIIIENQYLFIAHETGWPGFVLFLAIQGLVLWRLWKRRAHWFNLATFASGIGLVVVGLLLPVWVDDTISIVWWGAAAVALAIPLMVAKKGKKS